AALAQSVLAFGTGATAPNGGNYTIRTDGAATFLNVPNGSGFIGFTTNDSTRFKVEAGLITSAQPMYISGKVISGYADSVTAVATTPRTVTSLESGGTFTNEGAAALQVFDLPTAVAGLRYTFIVQDADGIQVNAAAADTIRVGAAVSAAAGLVSSTNIGAVVTIVAINATEWLATSVINTWTVT
ncbi:MAG TPA: hypothetical protein VNA25_29435, partial [Phycisphaerae bacterium]|nr:hypothetical protein [Phycisphaerae bacterium]